VKIVTSAEMREIDRVTSERFGVPSLTLMENAGTAVAEFALESHPSAKSFGVICGKGNNGGDGFVAARKLHDAGRDVRVLLLGDPQELKGDAAENFKRLTEKSKSPPSRKKREKAGAPSAIEIYEGWKSPGSEAVFESDVLIDAVLGTGFRPPVSGPYAEAIGKINATDAPVIAVDIPSGADADIMGGQTGAVARANAIVTFTAPRPAHIFGNLTNGPAIVAPIGSPEQAIQSLLKQNINTPNENASMIAPRPR
jgi:hydroxyethylthiazole kinase-like uncharacterized protein yjeF